MFNLFSKQTIFIRPRNRHNKFRRNRYLSRNPRESIERLITDFIRKLKRKAENSPLIRHRWIYNIRPKKFDLPFLFWFIAKPPDTTFRIFTI